MGNTVNDEESQQELISSFVNYVNNNYKGKYNSNNKNKPYYKKPYNKDKKMSFGEKNESASESEELSNNCVLITDNNSDDPSICNAAAKVTRALKSNGPTSSEAMYDNGSQVSLTGRRDLLRNIKKIDPMYIATFNGGQTKITEEGTLSLSGSVDILNVKYVPGAPFTILAGHVFTKPNKHYVVQTDNNMYLIPKQVLSEETLKNKSLVTWKNKDGLYTIGLPGSSPDKVGQDAKLDIHTNSSRKIPKKNEEKSPTSSDIRKELEQHRSNKQKSLSENDRNLANPVITRNRTTATRTPKQNSDDSVSTSSKEEDLHNSGLGQKVAHSDKSESEEITDSDSDA
jgi:hypothetical protein